MYTIWFRFHGVHSIEIEGVVEACMAWDALSSQFGMVSSRPCDGVGCTHECCPPVTLANDDIAAMEAAADRLLAPYYPPVVIKPEDDETW